MAIHTGKLFHNARLVIISSYIFFHYLDGFQHFDTMFGLEGLSLKDEIRPDCCDYCEYVDGTEDRDACNEMRERCKGVSCAPCLYCYRFRLRSGSEGALNTYSKRSTSVSGQFGAGNGCGRTDTSSSATKDPERSEEARI